MPKFDEGNRKRGIQCYLEASKEAKKETEINSLLSAKEDLSGCAAMEAFDKLNQQSGIAQYYSEASMPSAHVAGINSLLSAEEALSGCAAMATLDELNQMKGITPSYLEESSKLVEEIEKIDGLFSGKGVAGMGTIGDFDKPIYNINFIKRMEDEAELKAMEKAALKEMLHNSKTKENNMELQLDSRDYKDFLRLVKDKDNDWIDKEFYELFYRNNKIRRKRLLEAILDRKIKCKITIENEEALSDELQEFDENIIAVIDGCIDNYYDREGLPTTLLLEGASFFAWLNKEYPYEGTEKELKGSDSITDSPQSQKRENNLLKIIGGFVQTVYLQKDTGAYRNGDKPNISAIADAFQDELSKAGYSDKGFQNSSLRKIITDALERIEENKNS